MKRTSPPARSRPRPICTSPPTITAANLPSGGPAYRLAALGARLKVDATPNLSVLAAVFNAVGVVGGWLVGVVMIGVDAGAFWGQMQSGVDVWKDVGNGIVKSLAFGVAVTFIAVLQGFVAKPTPEGVSRATTRTVVVASLAVLGLDFILTALMFSI